MSYHWPADTDFAIRELDVLDRDCPACGRLMYVCDHRSRAAFIHSKGRSNCFASSTTAPILDVPDTPRPRARNSKSPSPRLTGRSAVHVTKVVNDPAPPVMRYEPGHPDADKSGYVAYPAINPIEEMVDLMGAARAYQLNAAAVSATKQMIQGAMDILK